MPMEKLSVDAFIIGYTKINARWTTDLSVNGKTISLLFWIQKIFINNNKEHSNTINYGKFDFIKEVIITGNHSEN